jgi:hypothetical protein
MQKSNAPTKLTVAFASGTGAGPVNTVPLTPGATPGTASYQTGFTTVNMEPIASGGIPPFGADFNGLFKAATTAQIWQQCGYTWTFDSSFASNANIGGYPAGSVLMMGSGNGLWINKTDNNTASPDTTGSSGWLGLPAVGAYTIATTGGTTTPDPSVLGVTTLLVTGTLTSNATLVLPLTAGSRWIVANNTTGSFTLTVQGATGAGVSITQGSALTVFTDGTAYFAASANLSGAYLPIDGTAVAATKLATPRAFSITGLATAAGVNFDGTGNVTLNVTELDVPSALGYTPANNASVVHIAGAETITGNKTFNGNAPVASGSLAGWQFNDRTQSNFWLWYSTGGTASLYSGTTGSNACSVNPSTMAWSFPASITATTANFTSSDRRLKRNIRKAAPRPLHRSVKFVSYTLKESGWYGLGSIAQNAKRYAPEHIGTFDRDGKTYLSLNYAGMAYEQAMWAGQEVDRLTKRTAKLERALERTKIEPRKRGFVRRLLEAIW